MMPRALLVHAHDWLGVARLPRLFRRAGMQVDVMGLAYAPARASRYVDRFLVVPDRPEAVARALRDLVQREGERYAWIGLCDDAMIVACAAYAGEAWLDRCYPVDHRSPEMRARIVGKFAFLEAIEAVGLPRPASAVVRTASEAVAAARGIGYPLMLKRNSGSGGTGVRKVHDESELLAAIAAFGDRGLNIEEFIDGDIGATEVLLDRGRPLCWWSFVKERRFPGEFGPSAVRRTFEAPGIAEALRGCGQVTGFHGFAALCWMWDPVRGRLALLELNPRQGSGMHLPRAEEMFAAGVRAMVEGRSAAFTFRPIPDGLVYRMFPQDLERSLAQRDLPGVVDWLPRPRRAVDVPVDDPKLLVRELRGLARSYAPGAVALASRVLRPLRSS